jgi:hypothetical protein
VTFLVLLVLAIVWAIVLLPPVLRARAEGRPADSIVHFHRQLNTLQKTGPRRGQHGGALPATSAAAAMQARAIARSSGPTRVQKRRRDILVGLMAAMAISLVLGAIPALHILLLVHVLADALFVGYVALLVRMRNAVAERDMKLSFLPGPARQVEPALLLRRSAN